jgi:DNA-directed RNA polymerase specialized sigma24 family protein
MSINDIAAVLECSPNTVKVHLHKGRQTLADRLDLEGGPK